MTRLAVTFDRVMAVIIGLLLIAGGAVMALWDTGRIPNLPRTVNASPLRAAAESSWWPWALLGVGLVLIAVGLRWLLIHTPAARVKTARLSTSQPGSVTISVSEVADAAATSLKGSIDIADASGRAIVDRGLRTVDLTVRVNPYADPTGLVQAINAADSHVAGMLADPTVATRTIVRVDTKARRTNRVR